MKNVGVLFGGNSVEHDISIITGVLTVNALKGRDINAVPIYIAKDGNWYLGEKLKDVTQYKNFDEKGLKKVTLLFSDDGLYSVRKNKLKKEMTLSAVINCTHGNGGEDGSLAGLFKFFDIPFCSPDILSSGLAQDKCVSKYALKGLNVPVIPFVDYKSEEDLDKAEEIGYPLIVKPARLGSSVGIKKANNRAELESALFIAKRYDEKILIEKYIEDFTEINCACFKYKDELILSPLEKPTTKNDVLTFNDKYVSGTREFPAKIDKKLAEKIKSITAKVYEYFSFSGVIRIDYIVKDKKVYLNEINAVPGSLAYYLFCEEDDIGAFLEKLIENGKIEYNQSKTLIRSFSSSVLNLGGVKSSKRL